MNEERVCNCDIGWEGHKCENLNCFEGKLCGPYGINIILQGNV